MRSALFEAFFVRSWWVWAFALICFGVHETLSHVQRGTRLELIAAIETERAAIEAAREEQVELRRQLASVDDPAWQELVLMRTLGVVPEGQVKVYFRGSE